MGLDFNYPGGIVSKVAAVFQKAPVPVPTPPELVSRERAERLRNSAAMRCGSLREMIAKLSKALATAEQDLLNAQGHLDKIEEFEVQARAGTLP